MRCPAHTEAVGGGRWWVSPERRCHDLDDGVHALELARAAAEGEVGDDDLVEADRLPRGHGLGDVVGGAGDGGAPARAGQELLGPAPVVGEQHERLRGALDLARIAADRLAALVEHARPLGDDVGQAPHVPLVGVAGDHAHHPVALAPDEQRKRVTAPASAHRWRR